MKKQTYKLLKQAIQFLSILFAVLLLTVLFSVICRISRPEPKDALEDKQQIDEMLDYHLSEGRNDIILF